MLEAYERLIHDAMTGDRTLFTTAEGVERLWEISDPLLKHPSPLRPYPKGSWGPQEIHELIAPRRWRLPFERKWRGDTDGTTGAGAAVCRLEPARDRRSTAPAEGA